MKYNNISIGSIKSFTIVLFIALFMYAAIGCGTLEEGPLTDPNVDLPSPTKELEPTPFSTPDFLIDPMGVDWVPTTYTEEILNSNDSISMNTEYPQYQPGVETLSLEITNISSDEFVFGLEFRIEHKREDGWYCNKTVLENAAWDAMGVILPAQSTIEHLTYINLYYGLLPVGEYRIIKVIGDTPCSAEFMIKEGE